MPVLNRIADFTDQMTAWRRHLHQHPELGFDCHETAAFVVERLRDFGVDEIHTGIAESGIVAIINGQGDGPTIGLRADMDALPMAETTGAEWASRVPEMMHACGHDGHTTMLLGAAKYLAETRNFAGRVALIFQPAEEGGGGADVMTRAGILDRFAISRLFALHTNPNQPVGSFHTTSGPIMAAVDTFEIYVQGRGGHGAMPHQTADPIVAAVGVVNAIQTISSRNHNPLQELALSVTQIHTGSADNIVPDGAYICGTVRTFDPAVRDMVARRMAQICDGQAAAYDVAVRLDYQQGYPATVNDAAETAFAVQVARDISGDALVHDDAGREMGAEDFSYFLAERPGCYLFLGQGIGPGLHNPGFDFNDDIAPIGASFFARLVERAQPAH
ncbi:M20 aminoacylase family protein [Paracoccus sp. (in: a-proteobacteria)]|uniref:M20 aminoacylase family protein n=1 Tax=Paracoccus sp. TaxID=267 RepID=UPI0026DF7EDB|nr:M20 aminoacylase family protein [Paracoccus sp. (in: a-proteobacteria)]MDO5647813.1 M20 aminoacylase family protein [Paracoccus sp. (in: a-proteobacteria)]